MDVYHTANQIFNNEIISTPELKDNKLVIDISSILHDMCDSKYVDETTSVNNMVTYMCNYVNMDVLTPVTDIIRSMSYSTVLKKGYPDLGKYQLPYNIVREADLLASYDVDRCIIYAMMRENMTYDDACKRAIILLRKRIPTYTEHNMFVTEYSKQKAQKLDVVLNAKLQLLEDTFGDITIE
tara:strand:- start:5 stop:550 length:546 start_codon:yes stop_codon:yes gene_type:complete